MKVNKNKVLLVELHMTKQRLERTDVCCRIRWSHSEQTSFWEKQVSSSLQTSRGKMKISPSVSVSHIYIKCKCHLLASRSVGGSVSPRSSSSTDLWTHGKLHLLDWSPFLYNIYWRTLANDDFCPPQVLVLAQSHTSFRKTSNVPEDSHTNFLKKYRAHVSDIKIIVQDCTLVKN